MSTAPMLKISTVPERWGSSSMSTATTPSTSAKHHPHRKAAHAVVVQSDNVGKHQHHRKFCDLAGL